MGLGKVLNQNSVVGIFLTLWPRGSKIPPNVGGTRGLLNEDCAFAPAALKKAYGCCMRDPDHGVG